MPASLLLPSSFYLALFWKDVGYSTRAGVGLMLATGIAVCMPLSHLRTSRCRHSLSQAAPQVLVLVTSQNALDIWRKLHVVHGAGMHAGICSLSLLPQCLTLAPAGAGTGSLYGISSLQPWL